MKPLLRSASCLTLAMSAAVCSLQAAAPSADVIVAADGSAQYKTVQEAINASPQTPGPDSPWTILVKPGTYKELIYVQREKRFVRLVGEDAEKTVLTYDLSPKVNGPNGKPLGTFNTPTVTIDADDFTVENLTLENSAGPVGQALALRVDGDRVVFRGCRFLGFQDTILANRGRQYFEDCYIAGAVDFIFGGATAFFERCHIHCLRGGYVTAASTPDYQPYGFVFSHCRLTGESPEVQSYLGRPWRAFASTIFMNTEMSEVVRPAGWNNWSKPEREKTTRYAEFGSTGPGANPQARAPWSRQLTKEEARVTTVERVLSGADGWDPKASAPVAAPAPVAPPVPAASIVPAASPVPAVSPTPAAALPFPLPLPSASPAAAATPLPIPAFDYPASFHVKTDIEYSKAGGETLRLDASTPEGDGPFPVAILVHGGGWSSGGKQGDIIPLMEPLAAAKFTWFSIDYRLSPKHPWPACFEDMQAAIRWVKAHAAEYKGDPARIALIGYSAGGQLVCQAAVKARDDTRVQAIVGFSPPTEMVSDNERRGGPSVSMRNLLGLPEGAMADATRAALREISPYNFIAPGLPPFLLVHGTEDKTVFFAQSVNLQAKLKESGVPCEIIAVKGAGHRLSEWTKFDPTYHGQFTAWLKQTLIGAKVPAEAK